MSFGSPWVLLLVLAWVAFCLYRVLRGDRLKGSSEERFIAVEVFLARKRARPIAQVKRIPLFFMAGIFFLLLALSRPQWGKSALSTQPYPARRILVSLDLSQSMMCQDVRPSRLDRAKVLLEAMLDRLQGEEVGMVVFAGTAFFQVPFTRDYEILRQLLGELDPSYLPVPGTRYGPMLKEIVDALGRGEGEPTDLVLLSDGEAHDRSWKTWLPVLKRYPVRIVALGIGTRTGAVIPQGKGLLRDALGRVVVSRLEPQALQELAQATGGIYLEGERWVDLASLLKTDNASLQQPSAEKPAKGKEVRVERFPLFLALAFLLLAFSLWQEIPAGGFGLRDLLRGYREKVGALFLASALFVTLGLTLQAYGNLLQTVEDLAQKPFVSAEGYAELALVTLEHAQKAFARQEKVSRGVLLDALEGVDRGERLCPTAAPWGKLREELARLLRALEEERPSSSGKDSGKNSASSPGSREGEGRSPQAEGPPGKGSSVDPGAFSGTGSSEGNPPARSSPRSCRAAGGQSSRRQNFPEEKEEEGSGLADIEEGDSQARILDRLRKWERTYPPETTDPW